MRKIVWVLLGVVMFVFLSSLGYRFPSALEKENKYDLGTFVRQKDENQERVKLIADPFDAYQARLAMIQSAKEEIFMTSYIIHPGETSDAMMSSLYDAAERGVQVSLVFDGKMGQVQKRYGALAKHPNIEIYRYNPFSLKHFGKLYSVYHEKYLWVDHQYLLMGGRNYGDKYFLEKERTVSLDYDVFVDGSNMSESVLDKVETHHRSLLNHPLIKRYEPSRLKKQRFYVDAPQVSLQELLEQTVPVKKIDVLFDPIGESQGRLFQVYLDLLDASEKSIFMQTPYMTKHREMLKHWQEKSDVPMDLLTNSVSSSPNFPAYAVYHRDKKDFLASDLGVYEYQDHTYSIHGKAYYFDRKYLYIGSMNLDHRSFYVNPESMLLIESEGLNQMFEDIVQQHLQKSYMVQKGHFKSGQSKPLKASFIKRIVLFITALFMRFFQHLV